LLTVRAPLLIHPQKIRKNRLIDFGALTRLRMIRRQLLARTGVDPHRARDVRQSITVHVPFISSVHVPFISSSFHAAGSGADAAADCRKRMLPVRLVLARMSAARQD
jgi:hypothetical protein